MTQLEAILQAILSFNDSLARQLSVAEENKQTLEYHESLRLNHEERISALEDALNEVIEILNDQGKEIEKLHPVILPPASEPEDLSGCYGGPGAVCS